MRSGDAYARRKKNMPPLTSNTLTPPRSALWVALDLAISALVVVAVALITGFIAATS
ncbi:hypothetical protein SAMN05444680_101173 [Variovorax sp. YR216]|nr:hypothetical protein SAMN05444680_101173 [Variovorax sp. YR216]